MKFSERDLAGFWVSRDGTDRIPFENGIERGEIRRKYAVAAIERRSVSVSASLPASVTARGRI